MMRVGEAISKDILVFSHDGRLFNFFYFMTSAERILLFPITKQVIAAATPTANPIACVL